MSSQHSPPVQTISIGLVKAAIWEKKREKGVSYSVTLARAYRDKDGKWQNTDFLDFSDLMNAQKVLEGAFFWIQEKQSWRRPASAPGPELDGGESPDYPPYPGYGLRENH